MITGLVQGVGFRYHMTHTAIRLDVCGWVRNRRDGSVEAVIAGEPENIAAMIHWSRTGPTSASVNQVVIEQIEHDVSLQGFHQRATT